MLKELDYEQLLTLNQGAFDLLRAGTILVVRQVPLVDELRQTVLAETGQECSSEERRRIESFFDTLSYPGNSEMSRLIRHLTRIRDSRYVSCLFSNLIGGMGLPEPVLIDTGHFRLVLPQDYASHQRPFEEGDSGPDLMVLRAPGMTHRDIDREHYTFQMNFWFPLHAASKEETLILFPEAYSEDVPYYIQPSDLSSPDSWGYGKALQAPLNFGDILIFHSQHFHASPTQSLTRNRLTVELRAVGGCIDDNCTYRRLFWNIRNFEYVSQPPGAGRHAAAAQLLERPAPQTETALTGTAVGLKSCYQYFFNMAFSAPYWARRAADVSEDSDVYEHRPEIGAKYFSKLVSILSSGAFAEDRLIATCRLALAQRDLDAAKRIAASVAEKSESYFWLLETSRICGVDWLDTAVSALERTLRQISVSPIRLHRFTPPLPVRTPGVMQLMPAHAKRAAKATLKKCRNLLANNHIGPAWLDYRLFYPEPVIVKSFELYDILALRSQSLYLALPRDRVFHPETILEEPGRILVGHHLERVEKSIDAYAGALCPEARSHGLQLLESYQGYNFVYWLNGIYVVPQSAGPINFFEENILGRPGCFIARSILEARGIVDNVHSEDI